MENPAATEERMIEHVATLTRKQLDRRYKDKPRVLRGVHPKDHGCVEAIFTVCEDIRPDLRVGLFRKPGRQFRAAIRFSNAAPLVTPDTPPEIGPDGKAVLGPNQQPLLGHGSRGMAVKLYDVDGERLVPKDGESTQDFLMINQPVFAFANVEDYEALNIAIADDDLRAGDFFTRPGMSDDAKKRADATKKIIFRIKGFIPQAFQPPPLSPLDNIYFSAAPFLFGKGRVMKFAAKPVNPVAGEPDETIKKRADYLREAMGERITEAGGKDICFDFQVQVRTAEALGDIETEIENMCTLWEDEFVTVARITIPPQDVASPERQEFCETLFYTPWHGLADHRPLGGINRLRRKVYEVSAEKRGCPVSPNLPPAKGKGGGAMGDKPGGGGLGAVANKAGGGKGFGGKPK